MENKIEQLTEYIQKDCLWQFFSRAWDREENIEGVLNGTEALLTGPVEEATSDMDRCHMADAKVLSRAFTSSFGWIRDMNKEELHALFQGVKQRMREIVITSSHNEELHVKNY
ncbi:V-containing nitrogenase subunit delta [Desulfobulbus rhabdoformis]|uniref:Fe-only/vanadium nitrogenase subunit delta n=1 Tax=Desulfobulbus rhabdoformis TaxID=34032 RepID=UPI001962BB2D|nr:Fe-only/vanadium nitrogenase subunit delta [Desulfobulbus rhabdoformis]MBM9614106.1 V-containing nitrogenase subunit delta [Desulfobulbus rhabdoformis]